MYAASGDHAETCRELLVAGASVFDLNEFMDTAYDLAAAGSSEHGKRFGLPAGNFQRNFQTSKGTFSKRFSYPHCITDCGCTMKILTNFVISFKIKKILVYAFDVNISSAVLEVFENHLFNLFD